MLKKILTILKNPKFGFCFFKFSKNSSQNTQILKVRCSHSIKFKVFSSYILFLFAFFCSVSAGFSVINITDCTTTQILNVSGETYLVQNNLTTTTTCLDIQADHITLDCQGHTLTGDGGDNGIQFSGFTNNYNMISNCNINNFGNGINLGYSDYNNLTNISIKNSTTNSVFFVNSASYNYFKNIIYSKVFRFNFPEIVYLNNVSDGNGKYIMSFVNSQVVIDGWNNLSQIILYNADNSLIKNLYFKNSNNYSSYVPILIGYTENSIFSNITSINYNWGLYSFRSNYNNYSNLNLLNNYYGFALGYSNQNNIIFNSKITDNYRNLEWFGITNEVFKNNLFYNNYLGNFANFPKDYKNSINFFNFTYYGINIGNYWTELNCTNSIINNSFEICVNPNNISLSINQTDFAPLVIPAIDVSYTQAPEGDYYSENVYIEVNASKEISSCTLYWNSNPVSMAKSGNICYTTQLGTFGNSYTYNVTVVGVNGATNTTSTKTVNLIDANVNYIEPPTPKKNINKYNLTNFTISFNDGGLVIDNCIFKINNQTYTNSPSGGYCNYTYSISQINETKISINFKGSYNVSGTITALEQRTINVYYGSQTTESKVPAFGAVSMLIALLLILGGLLK